MNLTEALQAAVREAGEDILSSPELPRHPKIQEALHGYPALLTVLSMAATSGCIARMVNLGLWDDDTTGLINRFVTHTGFQPEIVTFILKSVAISAGIKVPETEIPHEPKIINPHETAASSSSATDDIVEEKEVRYGEVGEQNPRWNPRLTNHEKTRLISGCMELDTEMEEELGVTLRYPMCTKVGEGNIVLSMEIARKRPLATGALHAAIYNMADAIVFHGLIAALSFSSPSRLPVTVTLPCHPQSVSRILLYWR